MVRCSAKNWDPTTGQTMVAHLALPRDQHWEERWVQSLALKMGRYLVTTMVYCLAIP